MLFLTTTPDGSHPINEELSARLEAMAKQRDVPVEELVTDALKQFLENEFLAEPMGLPYPVMPEGSSQLTAVALPVPKSDLPNPDDCPNDKIDEWLTALRVDLANLERALSSAIVEKDLQAERTIRYIRNRYRSIEEKLLVKKGKKLCSESLETSYAPKE